MVAPYGLTDSTETVTKYILNLIKTNLALINTVDIQVVDTDIWYGDQTLLPHWPAICVVPGPEAINYDGVGGRPVMIMFRTFVMVYYGVLQDIQANLSTTNLFANALKGQVHKDPTLGGNVIDCYCTTVEPGVAMKNVNALLEASRLTFQSRSKVALNP